MDHTAWDTNSCHTRLTHQLPYRGHDNIRGHASVYTLGTGNIQGSRTTYGVTHQSTRVTNIFAILDCHEQFANQPLQTQLAQLTANASIIQYFHIVTGSVAI